MVYTPNFFAFAALFLWVPVTIGLFFKLDAPRATALAMIGSVMFLPEVVVVDPPLLPPMDKTSLTAFWVLAACLWKGRARLRSARPFRSWDGLFVVVLLANFGTSVTNPDALVTGPVVRPGLGLYDAFALGIKDTLSIYLPFLLGRAMLRDRKDLRQLMRILTGAGIVYSVLALVEMRLSPQLHNWIYGFHQMDFAMSFRLGGYRPMIFMQTGIAVGMFMLCCAIAAVARWRAGLIKPWSSGWLSLMVVLCRSTGAIVYALVALPVTALRKKPKGYLPAVLAAMTLFYPALRALDVFPADQIVEYAEQVNEERALSLWFRFDQEFQLLERARERFWFGWGGYDRNRIFDPETGGDLSVTDGDWAIQIGTRGVVGFAAIYGMLTLPVIAATLRLRELRSKRDRILLGAFLFLTSLLIVDLLPNGLFHFLPFFFAGAADGLSRGVLGAEQALRRRQRRERAQRARQARAEAQAGSVA